MTDYTFLQLKKAAKSAKQTGCQLVLMGDCATQHLVTAIAGYCVLQNFPVSVTDTDYDLLDAQILDGDSELYRSAPEFVLLFLCAERLEENFSRCNDKSSFAAETCKRIEKYWQTIGERLPNTSILQFTFAEYDMGEFGNYALKTEESFLFQVKKLNWLLYTGFQKYPHVFPVDLNGLKNRCGHLRDDRLYYLAKMPVAPEMLPETAKQVVDVMSAVRGRLKKCVVCDLDGTLWGGVIGDDGLSGIQIGELGLGHAFESLQRWLKVLQERGILLAVCSKNNEETAKEPFLHHPEMVLHLDDFAMFVANWEDKASNIRHIQQTLNLGIDSFVFLDDNSFERELVRSLLPEVTVPELPDDPAQRLNYLKELNLFETASYSLTDRDRTRQYRTEAERTALERTFDSYDDYLRSLEMEAEVCPFDVFHTPRIAQLTQRSNQFNLRTVRFTEAEISALANNPDVITLYFTLRDRLGSHGLISVVVMRKQDSQTLFVENWLMSCRVLKRGMEEFIVNTLVESAKENGYDTIIGEYIPTAKNAMVADLYPRMGFVPAEKNRYVCHITDYVPHQTFIRSKKILSGGL